MAEAAGSPLTGRAPDASRKMPTMSARSHKITNAAGGPARVNKRFQPRKRTLELRKLFGSMPPGLLHWPNRTLPFDPAKSQVIAWLLAHPQAGQILFNAANEAKAIIYCPLRKAWAGRRHFSDRERDDHAR